MDDIKHYVLFPSYNSGLALEAALKRESIKYTIVPTPRELSSCCGIAIQYDKNNEEDIKKIVEDNCISVVGFESIAKKYVNFYGV